MTQQLQRSVATITVYAVVTRALGFLLRTYLAYRLGALLVGVYQVAFSFFGVLLGVVASGIPLTVSALTAKLDAHTTSGAVTSGLLASTVITAATVGLTLLCRKPLLLILADEASYSVLLTLLPALAFSGLSAPFRGCIWGQKRYGAVSVAELCEQLVRIAACVLLVELRPLGGIDGAHAAGLAMSVGCGASAILLVLLHFRKGYGLARPLLMRPLLSSALPITVVRVASSAVNLLIAVILPLRLTACGLSTDAALTLYGESVGMSLGFLFIPLTLTGSLSMALVPELSGSMHATSCDRVRRTCSQALSFAVGVAGLFVPIFLTCGEEIGLVFFSSARAGLFLRNAALVPLPLALEQIASSMMNSLGLEKRAFANFSVGSAVLLGVLWFATPALGVDALWIAMLCSYGLSMLLHAIALRERISLPYTFAVTLAKALPCCAVSCLGGELVRALLLDAPAAIRLTVCAIVCLAFTVGGYALLGIIRGGTLWTARKHTKFQPARKKATKIN